MSTSQTEESGENPWAAAQGTTMTSNSLGTPAMLDVDKENYPAIDESVEADVEPAAAAMINQKAADAAIEQQHLTRQLQNLARELKKSRSQAAATKALASVEVEPANWTARQMRLAQRVVFKWKQLRSYKMAEEILQRAVDVREANVIAYDSSLVIGVSS